MVDQAGGCSTPRRSRPRPGAMSPWSPGPKAWGRWNASGGRHRHLWGRPGRFARADGLQVMEADRPDRSTRRRQGKPDPIDAPAAARATLAGVAATIQDPATARSRCSGSCASPPRRPQSQGGGRRAAPRRARQRPQSSANPARRQDQTWSRCGRPCAPGGSPAPPPPPRPPYGPWPGAGSNSRANSTSSTLPRALAAAAAPPWSPCRVGIDTAGHCWHRRRHPSGSAPKPPSPISAARPYSRLLGRTGHHRLTRAGDAAPTTPCGASPWSACTATHRPGPRSNAGPTKACPSSTSCGAAALHRPRGRPHLTSPPTHPRR